MVYFWLSKTVLDWFLEWSLFPNLTRMPVISLRRTVFCILEILVVFKVNLVLDFY